MGIQRGSFERMVGSPRRNTEVTAMKAGRQKHQRSQDEQNSDLQ
jgi:hypothetical protein